MNRPTPTIIRFEDRADLSTAVARSIESTISDVLKTGGSANLMLSGGSTPIQAYRELSQTELDWNNVRVGLVDERWVPPDHPNSNEGMIRRELMSLPAKNIVSMWDDSESPFDSVDEIENRYKAFSSIDILVLGMGLDGHTASWFPESKGIDVALDTSNKYSVAAIDATGSEVAGDSPLRMTLTLSALARAKDVILMISGKEKWKVFESALRAENVSSTLPVSQAIRSLASVMAVYFAE